MLETPFKNFHKMEKDNEKLKQQVSDLKDQLSAEKGAHRPTKKTGVKKKRKLGVKTRTKWEQKKAQEEYKKKNIYDKKR